jgi:low affinity Fe/Cu permease
LRLLLVLLQNAELEDEQELRNLLDECIKTESVELLNSLVGLMYIVESLDISFELSEMFRNVKDLILSCIVSDEEFEEQPEEKLEGRSEEQIIFIKD